LQFADGVRPFSLTLVGQTEEVMRASRRHDAERLIERLFRFFQLLILDEGVAQGDPSALVPRVETNCGAQPADGACDVAVCQIDHGRDSMGLGAIG
jgi:hypothetical protein